jgi:trk system potassium uptake protein TrkA
MAHKRRVIVVGGGKVGSYLAAQLLAAACEVRVLEQRPEVHAKLAQELPEQCIVIGDGTDPLDLERAGIREADVLAAVTGKDEDNLVAASLAKFEYGVARVIVRVNNPRNAWLCTPEMGVDAALNSADLMASIIIEEMSVGDLQTLARLRQGKVEIVEEIIAAGSQAVQRSVAALALPAGCVISAVIRGGDVIVPNGSTVLQAGDEIVAVVQTDRRSAFCEALR